MEKVDGFLYDIIKGQEGQYDGNATNFLFKTEDSIISFLKSSDRMELEFPPLNSFYRRIVHCLGRRYTLVHRVEATNIFNSNSTLRKIYLGKPVGFDFATDGPLLKCSDWIPCELQQSELIVLQDDNNIIDSAKVKDNSKKKDKDSKKEASFTKKTAPAAPKLKILKRATTNDISPDTATQQPSVEALSEASSQLSLEEREAKYQAARDRIFEGFEAAENSSNVNVDVVINDHETEPAATNPADAASADSVPATVTTTLNPDAAPFSFTPSPSTFTDLTEPSALQIDHIYVLKPVSPTTSLSREDLQSLLLNCSKSSATSLFVTIKTRKIPTDSAFLLTGSHCGIDSVMSVVNAHGNVSIAKWEAEENLD